MYYERIEETDARGYKRVTQIDPFSDSYIQYVEWKDGIITSYHKQKFSELGWDSLQDFLRHRKGFVKINDNSRNKKIY